MRRKVSGQRKLPRGSHNLSVLSTLRPRRALPRYRHPRLTHVWSTPPARCHPGTVPPRAPPPPRHVSHLA